MPEKPSRLEHLMTVYFEKFGDTPPMIAMEGLPLPKQLDRITNAIQRGRALTEDEFAPPGVLI